MTDRAFMRRWLCPPLLVLFLGSLCAAASCSTPGTGDEAELEYVWPLPPEKARIRFIKSLWGEEDIRPSAPLDFIVGKEPSTDLYKPYGVAADNAGRVYVTDTIRKAVFVFDEMVSEMSYIGRRGDTLRVPVGVAVDNRERVYVTDTGHDAVFVFDRSGKQIRRFGAGLLDNPSGIAIDEARDRVYIVSTKTHRVEAFTLEGDHVFGFGGRGKTPGRFNFPRDIAVDGAGDLYVVDSANFRVQVFNSTGAYIREFGSVGSGPGQFSRPKGIALDAEGNVYVTDAAFNNFQIFDRDGTLLLFVGAGGAAAPGEFSLPADIFIDVRDRIYVVDQLNRRVQVFQKID